MLDQYKIKISEYAVKLNEGVLTSEEFEQLNLMLASNSESANYYAQVMLCLSNIEEFCGDILGHKENNEPFLQDELWDALAEHERTAPETITPKEEPPRELIQKVVYPTNPPRQVSKFPLYTAIISIAAVLFAIIYVQIAPPPATTVATITDSLNAQWAQSKHPADIGSELWNNEGTRWLHKGIVKIEFDYGAEVIIEGPTGFEMMDAEKMILHSGRLYATIPKSATGFTVQTPYSTIIDLGTEFGVKVDHDGTTDVHMLKGKASLIPGASRQKGESRELAAGQANRVDTSGQVKEIPLQERAFVRGVSSQSNFIWRGQKVIDLADIVGGGNGFGTGKSDVAIHLKDGNIYMPTKPFSICINLSQKLRRIPIST
jgi:hypothetical protein